MSTDDETKNTNEVLVARKLTDLINTKLEELSKEQLIDYSNSALSMYRKLRNRSRFNNLFKTSDFSGIKEYEIYTYSIDDFTGTFTQKAIEDKISSENYTQKLEGWEADNIQQVIEQEVDNVFKEINLSDLRIQEHQEEIDRLKVDTRKMIANLTLLIK